uniref:Uncharacterized protein n=1 Tax=Arundo donax TaxID=35708 RepID=A0A0A9BG26_ARUDO
MFVVFSPCLCLICNLFSTNILMASL